MDGYQVAMLTYLVGIAATVVFNAVRFFQEPDTFLNVFVSQEGRYGQWVYGPQPSREELRKYLGEELLFTFIMAMLWPMFWLLGLILRISAASNR